MLSLIIFLTCSVCVFQRATAAEGWGYETANGPSTWGHSYPICNQNHQSPVDIKVKDTKYAPELTAIRFNNYKTALASNFSLTNNGHTVQLTLFSSDASISGGNLAGTYRLQQLHFHWGANDEEGSEHQKNGVAYPLEIHLVHFNEAKYGNFSQAVDKPDGLAVLGVLVEVGQAELSPGFTELQNRFRDVMYKDSSTTLSNFALSSFLPSDTTRYYRYSGSLTTPPCYESVTWTVFDKSLVVPSSAVQKFRMEIKANTKEMTGHALTKNFRTVQQLNDRVVCKSFQDSGAVATWQTGFSYVTAVVVVIQLAVY